MDEYINLNFLKIINEGLSTSSLRYSAGVTLQENKTMIKCDQMADRRPKSGVDMDVFARHLYYEPI